LLWTTVLADLLIGLAYLVISVTLVRLARRAGPRLPYSSFFWAFGLFIVSCGMTHFLEVATVWKPVYWLSAAAKVVTAFASVGTAVVLLVAADDIVEFVRTAREAASRRGNERFRALIQATPMAVISSDLDGHVAAWNPEAERVFGWRSDEMMGRLPAIVPQEKDLESVQLRQKTIAGEVTTALESVRVNRQGQFVPVSISMGPVFGDDGAISGFVEVIQDISKRKQAEIERSVLEAQRARLEAQVRQAQKMEVLGRLAGGVAHDFNNMLMVLGGCSELLDRSLPRESSARIYLDQIQRTTEKAAAITMQLLTFSRKQVIEFRPMDLHEALTQSEFMLPRLLGSDVELTFCHEAAHSWILCDPSQIEQLVANLAVNSRDAMPEGGRLTVSTRNAQFLPEGETGDTESRNMWVVLEVADTGTGMDLQTRARIFEPFFTTKPEGKGTGLGLATVYGIVKQSHGHIHLESEPGNGARFEIYFPATAPAISAATIPAQPEAPAEGAVGLTILVADDQAPLRHALVEVLRINGHTVLESESSTGALDLARDHQGTLDVLLTDVVMPGLRGPELARRVAKVHPEVQVMYMSGYAENSSDSQLPPDCIFLQKPFRFATLLERLKLVRRRS
jgi:PAS domain S-box-containing protein